MEEFERYYGKKFGQRRLTWIHSLASVTISTKIKGKQYEFLMNGFQAAILLALNDHPNGLTIEKLSKQTLLPPSVLKRVLLSLVVRSKLLVKKPKKEYNKKDIIMPNSSFASAQRRLRVPSHKTSKDTKTLSRKKTMAAISEDRKGALEVGIVRILKARKIIGHRELVMEVMSLMMGRSHFKPDPRQIKQRIESLMSREYLRRDPNNSELYEFLG